MVHSRINQSRIKWPDIINNDFIRNVINAFPYDVQALYELVRIYEIVYSDEVPTAAMQMAGVPRIKINKKFLDEWAYTWTDVAVLIHHEITHRMLLHVREELNQSLGAILTNEQMNLLLDIRVQGLSYQVLGDPVYRVFANRYYANTEYPVSLLASGSTFGSYRQRQLHKEIYSPFGVSLEQTARFIFGESGEAFVSMPGQGESNGKSGENEHGSGKRDNDHKSDKDGDTGESGDTQPGENDLSSDTWEPFIGSHGNEEEEIHIPNKEALKYADEVRRTIEYKVERESRKRDREKSVDKMIREGKGVPPNSKQSIKDWGSGRSEYLLDLDKVEDYYTADQEMKDKMMSISVESEELKAKKALKALFPDEIVLGTRPNFRDKRAVALYSIGVWPVFFENVIENPRGLCHIYIDDSGSQFHVIAFVVRLFAAMKDYLAPEVHFFSTMVWSTHKSNLKPEMQIETTGGTDMNCVVEHALENKIQKCLVITDGYGPLSEENARKAKQSGQKYLIGFTEESKGDGFNTVEWKRFDIPKEKEDEEN